MPGVLQKIREYPIRLLLRRSSAKPVIEADFQRYVQMRDPSRLSAALEEQWAWLFVSNHTYDFLTLLYYRIGRQRGLLDPFLLFCAKQTFKPLPSLTIKCPSIGPGLVIQHGFGTLIEAEKIGKGCLIFHDVTIGFKDEPGCLPTLGDYVHIGAGARVLGRITIGDHAVIAANAVVTKDMPPNSLAVGIPANFIENAGNKAIYIASGVIPE